MTFLFKKLRFSLRFLTAVWKLHKRLLLIAFIIGVLSFFFIPKLLFLILRPNEQKIGLVGRFTTDDLPFLVQNKLSRGLTKISDNGEVEPDLAESWEILNGGRQYIFNLKDNLYWQDGQPIIASDINYHFNDVTMAPINNKQLRFDLKEPYSPFPAIVSRPVFTKNLIGAGDYRIRNTNLNGHYLEKLTLTNTKDKNAPQLTYRFYPTETAGRTAFKLGEIDQIYELSLLGDLEKWHNFKSEPVIKYNRFVAIFLNNQFSPLDNKSIRQALAYAVQKRWQPRALSSINPQNWAYNSTVKPYPYDLVNAQQLLKKGDTTAFTEIELSTIPSLLDVAEQIKKDWSLLGIETKIKVISSLDPNYQALLAVEETPIDPDQYILWHSTQETNISHYKSPKVDKLLEDGRKILNLEERKQIYQDFQRFLIEDSPVIFLYHPTLYTITRI